MPGGKQTEALSPRLGGVRRWPDSLPTNRSVPLLSFKVKRPHVYPLILHFALPLPISVRVNVPTKLTPTKPSFVPRPHFQLLKKTRNKLFSRYWAAGCQECPRIAALG
ncbi:hypothetical protein TNCT_364061 [Trichonephila clavata]|uniref:Uncharacterized protein n=1 Tax=Trichonephila clavata TaxID=2740835 RepID=A0A8X6GSE1_TRICU|nr:hypothetical protein TNCT_364061 [Trichonephila clavata]